MGKYIDEAQLFGYEAIRAGQQFAVRIDADDDLPSPLWQRVKSALVGGDPLLL